MRPHLHRAKAQSIPCTHAIQPCGPAHFGVLSPGMYSPIAGGTLPILVGFIGEDQSGGAGGGYWCVVNPARHLCRSAHWLVCPPTGRN